VLRLLGRANRPIIIGHRGAMGHAPENTMASFELALAMGAEMVELDVHPSRDGELVVIHDHTLDRTTDGHGVVTQRSVSELKALDAGGWLGPQFAGERIPTLREVLAWARPRVPLAIELKAGPLFYPGIEQMVIEQLREYEMIDRAVIISFDHPAIRRVKDIESGVATGILYAARLVDGPAVAAMAKADALAPQYSFVTPEVVEEAHDASIAVSVWTVDDEETMKVLRQVGVDAISTNYPDRLARILAVEYK
jgi:glycerophosphoryl diester phosphodiesterase